MGRKRKPTLATRLQAERVVEEQLRPALPAHISATSTWLLTAKELMDSQPEVYAGIVMRLADGDTVPQVTRLTGLDIALIRKIRDLHPEVIEAGIKAAHSRILESLHNASQRLADNIDSIPVSSLPISVAVLVDKVQLIRGEATTRIEHKRVSSPEELKAMFAALPEANVTLITEEPKCLNP